MKKTFILLLLSFFYFNNIQAQDKNFTEEEITFKNGENTFSGTLSIPKKGKKFPAIILISGSGPQTRDSDIYGFKTFKTMAEYFSNRGIVVLRYDDRGTGKTTGKTINESTSEDFAEDVVEAFKYLSTRKEINPKKIGLLGHSEGGIVAPLAFQKESKIAFTILMAGPTVDGGDIILAQTEALLRASGASQEDIDKTLKQSKRTQEIIKTNGDWNAYEEELIQIGLKQIEELPEEQKKYITDPEAYIKPIIKQQLQMVKSKWYQGFIKHDPRNSLENLTCPTLALFGGLDLQVLVSQNKPPLETAIKKAKNKDFTVKVFEKANHLFQEAKIGSTAEYAQLEKAFIEGFLEYIYDWTKERFLDK